MTKCKHVDNFGKCGQPVLYKVDKDKLEWQEWMTGRKGWGGEPEIICEKRHPIVLTGLCYFHTKREEGLI